MSTLEDNFVEQEKMTTRSRFLDQLTGYIFVDMGVISNAAQTRNGYRCNVTTFRIESSQEAIYDNVEILMLGNSNGGLDYDLEGSDCIVFGAFSSATAIGEGTILGTNRPYDLAYLKCLPVSNPAFWKGTLRFDDTGNMSYKTANSLLRLGIDGSAAFEHYVAQQKVVVEPDGDIIVSTSSYKYFHRADGSYYKYQVGAEAGKIAFFESYKDKIKDIFYSSIAAFEPEDGEDDEWTQLLNLDSWMYHEHTEEDVVTVTIKNTDEKIIYIKETRPDLSYTITRQEDEDKVLSVLAVNPDGTFSLVNTNSNGDNMWLQEIKNDGSMHIELKEDLTIDLKDKKIDIAIGNDVTATLTDTSIQAVTGNASLNMEDGKGEFVIDKTSLESDGSKWTVDANGCAIEITSSKITVAGNLEVMK